MNRTILIANDEDTVRYALKSALTGRGYRFLEARNGRECLDLAARHHPHLIILDLIMPGLDGFTTLGRLKAAAATAAIPVVISADQGGKTHRQMARDLGSAEFLHYKDDLEKVAGIVEKLLERQSAPPSEQS